ncbi:MAG: hypothetical protein ACTHW1_03375 [Ancrocorticia sp.]|uniref:hypothetical protein n=1 Tax=Ancrocorticia sp. TaxID=2593684 RepID=UPI003F908D33
MDDIVKAEDTTISTSDEQFAIAAFKKSISDHQQQALETIDKVAQAAMSAANHATNVAPLLKKPEVRYVVDATKDVQEALAKGLIKFDTNKAGDMFAQFRDTKGRFGPKVPIKEELVNQGINPADAASAMQLRAMQQQLNEITEALESITEDIAEVIQGQQNDRLGLYFSGMNLYLEARQIQDGPFGQLVSAQAVKALSDASSQMALAMQSDVQYLLDRKYENKKSKRAAEIESRMASINKCFEAIHRSYVLKAAVYFDLGETSAMLTTIDEYGRFLNATVIPNTPKLRELDPTDVLLRDGIWENRSKSISGVDEIRKQLSETTTYYLEPSEDAEQNDER